MPKLSDNPKLFSDGLNAVLLAIREEGIAHFTASQHIEIPEGNPEATPERLAAEMVADAVARGFVRHFKGDPGMLFSIGVYLDLAMREHKAKN